MNNDLLKIKQMCERNRIRAKLVLVPGLNIKAQMLKALNDAGISPLNLTVHTVGSLVSELAVRRILADNLEIIDLKQTEDIVSEILAKGKAERKIHFFSRLETTPGLCSVLASSIRELLMGGYQNGDTTLSRIENEEKAKDLLYILHEYAEFKAANRLVDFSDLIMIASKCIDEGVANYPYIDCVVLASCRLSFIEKQLLAKLGIQVSDSSAELDEVDVAAMHVRFMRAQGCYVEMKAVLRDIMSKGIPFDKVLLVGTQKDPYGQLLYQLLQQYIEIDKNIKKQAGFPVTFGTGLPLVLATPTKLLLSLLDWVEGGYKMHDLVTVFATGEMSLDPISADGDPEESKEEKVNKIQIINGLKRSGITWQRHTYINALEKYIEKIKNVEHQAKRMAAMEWLRDLLRNSIFKEIPETNNDGYVKMNDLSLGLLNVVKKHKKVLSALDGDALLAIEHVLKPSIPDRLLTEREAISILRDRLKNVRIHIESPSPGKIHYTTYHGADFIDREHVYLLGFNATAFPGLPTEDPVLLDNERDDKLVKSRDKINWNLQDMHKFMSSVTENLILSYSFYDTEEKREMYPAVMFNQIKERYPEEAISRVELNIDPNMLCIDEEDFWISSAKNKGAVALADPIYGEKAVGSKSKHNSEGRIVPTESESIKLESLIDLRENQEVTSASALESFFECKYKYYLKNVLHLSEIRNAEVDVVGWLSSFEIGHIYHKVFEEFCREVKDHASLLQDVNEAENFLLTLAESEINRCEKELPVASQYHTQRQKKDISDNCIRFLEEEIELKDQLLPEYFELEFGKSGDCSIVLEDGRHFYAQGFVDRVDKLNDGTHLISDYKTGGQHKYGNVGLPETDELDAGSVQLLLYYLALKYLSETEGPEDFRKVDHISNVQYRFVTDKGNYESIGVRVKDTDDEKIQRAFSRLMDAIATGQFIPKTIEIDENEENPSEDNAREKVWACKFCAYLPMCKYRATEG
ncbi:MAG: hypothetical protein EOM59_09295 [Clostridia bacterium]|nr:hypothetical protein [Clostridia bacterium]